MMFRTATVQVNLDFSDEADMVAKLRVGLALQPVATALFANSPFTDGKPNGYQSYRAEMWRDTDPDRTGLLPFAFEPGMGFERYVDYALDVPMYFVYRDGTLYRRGRRVVPGFPGRQARGPAGRCGRRSTIGPIISPRCSPMSGSSASSRCAAPMPARSPQICGAAGAVDGAALRPDRRSTAPWR